MRPIYQIADFSSDTWVIMAVKALLIFLYLVVSVLLMIVAERKIVGRMQYRPGPNRFGPAGLLQSLADGVKLMLKEDIIPTRADKFVFVLAPILVAIPCWLAYAVIPFGPAAKIPGTDIVTPLQLTDFPAASLYVLAVTAIGVYGFVLAGWSSGSTYPLLGGIRSTAQVISYELAMGLSLVAVFIYAGSMSTSEIVDAQAGNVWFAVTLFPMFIIYVISMVGETNRLPFDLPEAEGELVGGFHTEYSSIKFAFFFLAEYVNMFAVAGMATTLFLGGWQAPWPLGAEVMGTTIWEGANSGLWPILWFTIKVWGFMFLFIWLRGTLPRFRYDQFMKLGWKVLIPAALALVFFYSVLQAVQQFWTVPRTAMLAVVGVLTIMMILLLIVEARELKNAPKTAVDDDELQEYDPMAGGYPVPPLPGQKLPESPRAARRAVTASAQEVSDE